MNEDQNVYTALDGKRYRAKEHWGHEGCAFWSPTLERCAKPSPKMCGLDRADGRSVIWVRDDQPAAPAPVLTLVPPVDALDLARMLTSLRPGARLTVSVEGGSIVVREADNG